MLSRLWFRVVLGVGVAAMAFGCGEQKKADVSAKVMEFPRNQTLYIGGFNWGTPNSFNPLHVAPAFPMTSNIDLVYETMFGYNQVTGQLEGLIGTSFDLQTTTLRVELNPKAAWHDGTPLTSADVVYTFNLHKTYNTHMHSTWNYLDDVKADGPNAVVFTLSQKNYNRLILLDIISTVLILPQKVFAKLEAEGTAGMSKDEILTKMREFKNDTLPLGSGPYTLSDYSDQKIVLKRIENYWGNDAMYGGKKPGPTYIIHLSYNGNDKYNLALQQGDLDISATFCPQIWNKFSKGVGTWLTESPYYLPGMIPSLLMCLQKAPFNDVVFRRAVAQSIDYDQIRTVAIYGYSPPLQPGFILPFGNEKQYISEQDAKELSCLYDPAKARQILAKAGYTWGADSLLIDPTGKKIPTLFATCPSGWTDWETTVKIAVSGMRAIGIDAREKFLEYPVWDKELKNGLFDFTMKTPHPELSPSCPWMRFEKVMSTKYWAPVGQVMYENEGRFKNAQADSLLLALPRLTDQAEIIKGYQMLNRIFMSEMPVVPLMYRPWHFYQFSTRTWTNFPTAKNPYSPPQCLIVGAGVKGLWGIQSAK
jgi:peptide/nickel transport system substrate-binding protein